MMVIKEEILKWNFLGAKVNATPYLFYLYSLTGDILLSFFFLFFFFHIVQQIASISCSYCFSSHIKFFIPF